MAPIADIKTIVLEITIVTNISLFCCTCFINFNSFRNVNSIEIWNLQYIPFIEKKNSVFDFSLYKPFF